MDLKTAVFNAARDGKLRLLTKLLANKTKDEMALLMSEKTNGATPLLMAARYGHLDMVEHLLEHCSASIEIGGSVNFDGHKEIAQYLLEKGADVNRKSVKGNTALHDCAESGSLEIMKMLLKYCAKMEKDGQGKRSPGHNSYL
ncbi:protein fem-1 like C [Crotalus adamanteus]|uniref:Protein fem-1 like C n=1 Tax=Crotalus adamanteus TaxID=8729 RepID=A0AAW1C133_CROAD